MIGLVKWKSLILAQRKNVGLLIGISLEHDNKTPSFADTIAYHGFHRRKRDPMYDRQSRVKVGSNRA